MDGKFNHRVDTLLKLLFKYAGLMCNRIMISDIKGGVNDKRSRTNFVAHKDALEQSWDLVNQRENVWCVDSFESPGSIVYEVKHTLVTCPYNPCPQACVDCGVCWHRYMCNCPHAIIANNRTFSCKHAHLVKMKLNNLPAAAECNGSQSYDSAAPCNVIPPSAVGLARLFLLEDVILILRSKTVENQKRRQDSKGFQSLSLSNLRRMNTLLLKLDSLLKRNC